MNAKSEFSVRERQQIVRIEIRRLVVHGIEIAAEERMFITDVVVDPADAEVLVGAGLSTDGHFAAGFVRSRKTRLLQDSQ